MHLTLKRKGFYKAISVKKLGLLRSPCYIRWQKWSTSLFSVRILAPVYHVSSILD